MVFLDGAITIYNNIDRLSVVYKRGQRCGMQIGAFP